MDGGGLMDNGSDAVRFDDAPDKESDPGDRDDDGFHREQMSATNGTHVSTAGQWSVTRDSEQRSGTLHFVDREPDGG